MQTLPELGTAIAVRRQALALKQGSVAAEAGIAQESLSRFERGHAMEFGTRKLLAVLAILGMEMQFVEQETKTPTEQRKSDLLLATSPIK